MKPETLADVKQAPMPVGSGDLLGMAINDIQIKMKTEIKIIICGMMLCIAGAILLDIHAITATATTLILLGVFTILAGPTAANL